MSLLRARDVAARLSISLSGVYALVNAGKLGCARVGLGRGTIRVSEEQLQAYLDSATVPSEAEKAARSKSYHGGVFTEIDATKMYAAYEKRRG